MVPVAVMAIVLVIGGWCAWSYFNADEPERTRSARHADTSDEARTVQDHAVADSTSADHPRTVPGNEIQRPAEVKAERVAVIAPQASPPPAPAPVPQPAPAIIANAPASPPASAATPAAVPKQAEQPTVAQADQLVCPECAGEGSIPCPAHCNLGKVRCPASCLKKDDPGWAPGQGGKTWMTFPSHRPDGQGGHMWSTLHIGQLIVYEDGVPVNKGICPTCKGTSVVDCKKCDGKGALVCPLCKGQKTVGKADADIYLAALAAEQQKHSITLSDGRVLKGKIIGNTADNVIIRTEDGKMELVDPKTIVSSPAPDSK
jgi:hypothetical protein